jgi:hypothetical protein
MEPCSIQTSLSNGYLQLAPSALYAGNYMEPCSIQTSLSNGYLQLATEIYIPFVVGSSLILPVLLRPPRFMFWVIIAALVWSHTPIVELRSEDLHTDLIVR